jgi:sulfur carrier protein
MNVIVNGEACSLSVNATVVDALEKAGAANKPVAVVVNEEIVRPDRRAAHRLQDGDKVEILNFAGGG